jgi:type IV pilus assembly protein PilA
MKNDEEVLFVRKLQRHDKGFTLIELMIVIGIIAIIITLALPVYSNYTIRAKVGEALSIAAGAKNATSDTCQSNPLIAALTPDVAGFLFDGSPYVESIDISGPCTQPVITLVTRNTGATETPVLTLTGDPGTDASRIDWTCEIVSGQNIHIPSTCRS